MSLAFSRGVAAPRAYDQRPGYTFLDIWDNEQILFVGQPSPPWGNRYTPPERNRTHKGDLPGFFRPAPKLTKRQLEILSHITKGKTNKEIAVLLGIREDSVGEHLTAIFQKLGVSNRAEAVAIALRKQLLKM